MEQKQFLIPRRDLMTRKVTGTRIPPPYREPGSKDESAGPDPFLKMPCPKIKIKDRSKLGIWWKIGIIAVVATSIAITGKKKEKK